jgi:dihydroceramidase
MAFLEGVLPDTHFWNLKLDGCLTLTGDDLSMFLAVGALLHQLLCFEATPAQRRNYTLAILGVLIPVSTYHVVADEIYVHEIVFAAMVIMVVRKTRKLIRERVKNEEHKKRMGQLATFGIGEFRSVRGYDPTDHD